MDPDERPGDMDMLTWLLRVRPGMRESEFEERWKNLVKNPELAKMTWDELHADIALSEARIEDMEKRHTQLYRDYGVEPLYDSQLFISVMRGFRKDATMDECMEAIRRKKRRGHKQQEALDIYDEYYRDGHMVWQPTEGIIERLEILFDEMEIARECGVSWPGEGDIERLEATFNQIEKARTEGDTERLKAIFADMVQTRERKLAVPE